MSNSLCYMANIQMFIILLLTNQPLSFGLLFLRDLSCVHNFVYCFILLANLFNRQLPIDPEIIVVCSCETKGCIINHKIS